VSAPFIGGEQRGAVRVGGDPLVFLVGVAGNTLIAPGGDWSDAGYTNFPGFGSQLPEFAPTYMPLVFDLGLGSQFGWVGVTFDPGTPTLDAFAWGYETEVGVPIAAGAPEPATLAALALGAAAVAGGGRPTARAPIGPLPSS
jgi:hypothetical protein